MQDNRNVCRPAVTNGNYWRSCSRNCGQILQNYQWSNSFLTKVARYRHETSLPLIPSMIVFKDFAYIFRKIFSRTPTSGQAIFQNFASDWFWIESLNNDCNWVNFLAKLQEFLYWQCPTGLAKNSFVWCPEKSQWLLLDTNVNKG